MSDFTFLASTQTQGAVDPRTLETSYGGGYEQRSGDGINATLQKYTLSFTNRSKTDLATIHAFLKARAGWQSFTWTPQFMGMDAEGELHVKCKHWDWVYEGGDIVSISATFEQVAFP